MDQRGVFFLLVGLEIKREALAGELPDEDRPTTIESPGMTVLSAFGLLAVTAMLVCYAFEARSPWFILGFAVSCGLGSAYGFLQGAWPFGVVEAIWACVAVRRWWTAAGANGTRYGNAAAQSFGRPENR